MANTLLYFTLVWPESVLWKLSWQDEFLAMPLMITYLHLFSLLV